MSGDVSIRNTVKRYKDFVAVNNISIDIEKGEFFTLLGPSGCGKTTLLRMIAGFNTIEEGEIYIKDRLINKVEAHKRDIGLVFQNYAIFPHMTVRENVAYGLKAKHMPKSQIDEKVREALKQVQIEQLADRKPNELSGGQQQRVALARAFVIEPGVLLMDEPLSNLDAKLRVQMRSVIKRLQNRLGITTIYVTHDQEEALAISDRIAVMKNGNIMQIGTPEEIYGHPANVFVAGFIGTTNFIKGTLSAAGGTGTIRTEGREYQAACKRDYQGEVILSVRPEHVRLADEGIPGEITFSVFLGDYIEYEIRLESGSEIRLNEYLGEDEKRKDVGQKVFVQFEKRRMMAYDPVTEEVITC